MPLVGINAHLLSGQAGYRQAGIHTYTRQILNHLPRDDELSYRVFTQQGVDSYLDAGVQVVSSRVPTANPMLRIAWEQSAWPTLARQAGVDLLHSMAFVTPVLTRLPTIVTVYDLSPVHYPEAFTPFKRWYLQTQMRRSARAATRVVAIAEDGKRDIHESFGVPLERIDVVPPVVGAEFRPIPTTDFADFRQQHNLTRPFILHVGTLQPRKNIPILIKAFAALKNPELDLVLIGGKGWLYDEIFTLVEQLGLKNNVHFTGFASAETLPYYYNAASLFVMPSVYEGFGIPIVEAMACGTPVIVANASSLPEVAGEAGLLFDPNDVDELTERINSVLTNKAQTVIMRDRGLVQAENYSWTQSGHKMADIYRKAIKKE